MKSFQERFWAKVNKEGPVPKGAHTPNTPCWLWTADNARDRVVAGMAKGVSLPGESNPRSKLTAFQVREIRTLYAAGGSRQADLARKYGLSQSVVSRIIRRVAWPHVAANLNSATVRS